MSVLLGIIRYEYSMAIRRWGVWIGFLLAGIPVLMSVSEYGGEARLGGNGPVPTTWELAGLAALLLNLLPPVVGGIAMADRLARDSRLNVDELLRSTPLSRSAYIAGKYAGAVLASLTPVLVLSLLGTGLMLRNGAPAELIWASLVAFLGIVVPAYLFVGAFAIACPAVMPVRVFQVLYTGYWFWGNYLNPKVMPTLSDTVLAPSGKYVRSAFFGVAGLDMGGSNTPVEAVLNLVVLAACAILALVVLDRILAWRESHA